MPTLSQIRQAIDNTVQNNIPGLRGFNTVPNVSQLPAMVVTPARDTADFTGAMGRGMDVWRFDLYVLVQLGEAATAQDSLDNYVSGSGPRSIRAVIYEHPDLGLGDDTDATCEGVRDYGGRFQDAGIKHLGAIVRLTVRTSGK
jgi:hypothetical protein